MATVYPVMGCWRSGTTLVTSILQSLGVFVGTTFKQFPDASWAPTHTFADSEFDVLFQRLVSGSKWPISYGYTPPNVSQLFSLSSLIASRNANFAQWGFKNEWTHFVWPSIRSLLNNATVKPIITSRSGDSSIASYATRIGLTTVDSQKVVQPGLDAIASLQIDLPNALVISFDNLVGAKSLTTVTTIAAYVGMNDSNVITKAASNIDPNWSRF